MRRVMFLLAIILLLSVTSTAGAVTHVVQKRECLSVIGSIYNVSWRKIAQDHNIKKPFIIHPKQRLTIAENDRPWKWKNHANSPYGNRDPIKAIKSFRFMPKLIKNSFMKEVQSDNYSQALFKTGEKRKEMVSANGIMGTRRGGVINTGKDEKVKRYRTKDQDFKYILDAPIICTNWTWDRKPVLKQSLPIVPVFTELPPVPVFGQSQKGLPSVPVFTGQKEDDPCGFDLYFGSGFYQTDRWLNSNNKNYDHWGGYDWIKGRYRPFSFEVSDEITACFGAFGFGAFGFGHDQDYDYWWRKWSIGPSLKLIDHKNHWDADFDLGLLGELTGKGREGLYKGRQVDNINIFSTHLNLYKRLAEGKKWFSKSEFNLELTLSDNEYHKHSWDGNSLNPDPSDNQVFELLWTQHIYDFGPDKDGITITPGFNLAYINEHGRDNPNFVQFGPRFTSTWNNQDIVSISLLNYRENINGDGDQWHWFSGHVSVSGLIKAYKSSQITEATEEELCSTCM